MGRSLALSVTVVVIGAFGVRWSHGFCFEEAGKRYGLPPGLVALIAEEESGLDPSARHENRDGTYDVGLMQINSFWRTTLGPERWEGVCADPCYNVMIGSWVLANCLARHGYTVEGLGCYNATSEDKRAEYAGKIVRAMERKLKAAGKRRR